MPGTYCRPVENPTAPSAIARQTSDFIRSSSGMRRDAIGGAHHRLADGVVADERREVDRGAGLTDPGQRLADVERRGAAVAGDDRRHAHADEVLGARMIGEIVGVRVHVDEAWRDDQARSRR